MKGLMLLVVLMLLGAACDGAECTVGETRCSGEQVEVCDGDARWTEVADCTEVEGARDAIWSCCEVRGRGDDGKLLHACLPTDRCAQGAD